jgi:hypothetical protein
MRGFVVREITWASKNKAISRQERLNYELKKKMQSTQKENSILKTGEIVHGRDK